MTVAGGVATAIPMNKTTNTHTFRRTESTSLPKQGNYVILMKFGVGAGLAGLST